MSSYLSNLLTHTTSRYASLRRTLLSTEDDGDTPDDTHICRVLRAYYTEKNRAFPDWLPPDPNKKVAQQQQQPAGGYAGMNQNSTWGRGQVGALRGEGREPVQRASLSDLWDAPAGGQGGTTAPQSLRAARRPMQNPAANASVGGLAPPPVQGRPLPSQRAGSYQSVASQSSINLGGYGAGNRPGSGTSFESGSGGGTAQERLKARLWGAARVAGAGGGGGGGGNEAQDDGSGRRYGR